MLAWHRILLTVTHVSLGALVSLPEDAEATALESIAAAVKPMVDESVTGSESMARASVVTADTLLSNRSDTQLSHRAAAYAASRRLASAQERVQLEEAERLAAAAATAAAARATQQAQLESQERSCRVAPSSHHHEGAPSSSWEDANTSGSVWSPRYDAVDVNTEAERVQSEEAERILREEADMIQREQAEALKWREGAEKAEKEMWELWNRKKAKAAVSSLASELAVDLANEVSREEARAASEKEAVERKRSAKKVVIGRNVTKESKAALEQLIGANVEKERAAAALALSTQEKARARREAKAKAKEEEERRAVAIQTAMAETAAADAADAAVLAAVVAKEDKKRRAVLAEKLAIEAVHTEVDQKLARQKVQRERKLTEARGALEAASQKAMEGQRRILVAKQTEKESESLQELWRGRRGRTALGTARSEGGRTARSEATPRVR